MLDTAVADRGLSGDRQTAALGTTDESIEWFCPRLDSPGVFGALPYHERGGHFGIRAAVGR